MTESETILKMIETVDPADTTLLREIDERVSCFLACVQWRIGDSVPKCYRNYSTSRNALKAIRPKGWKLEITSCPLGELFWVSLTKAVIGGDCENKFAHAGGYEVRAYEFPTEELAELHAIIQAIEYERVES